MIAFPGLDFTRKEMTIVGSRASVDCFPESLALLGVAAFAIQTSPRAFPSATLRPSSIASLTRQALHKAIFLKEPA